jgi:hypothetical protein
MSENRVLRKTFGPKREEVAGEWRRLHNGELHNLYASLNIIRVIKSRRMRLTLHVVYMEMRCTQNFPEGNRPLGRPRCQWKYNIRMDLWKTG